MTEKSTKNSEDADAKAELKVSGSKAAPRQSYSTGSRQLAGDLGRNGTVEVLDTSLSEQSRQVRKYENWMD